MLLSQIRGPLLKFIHQFYQFRPVKLSLPSLELLHFYQQELGVYVGQYSMQIWGVSGSILDAI